MGAKQKKRKMLKEEALVAKREEIRQRASRQFWGKFWKGSKYAGVVLVIGAVFFGGKWALAKYSNKGKSSANSTAKKVVDDGTRATIVTNKGSFVIKFYKNDAPKTVENFTLLAKRGYYNGIKFHRYEPGFVIQGGDPLSKDKDPKNDGTGGVSAWGGKFNDELNADTDSYKRSYARGVVAMANSGANTNGSQFFIVLKDKKELPPQYTIFGEVVSGMSVVDKLRKDDVMKKVIITQPKSVKVTPKVTSTKKK